MALLSKEEGIEDKVALNSLKFSESILVVVYLRSICRVEGCQ
jgi:hypothetical protein